jgi:hypothetical protein
MIISLKISFSHKQSSRLSYQKYRWHQLTTASLQRGTEYKT